MANKSLIVIYFGNQQTKISLLSYQKKTEIICKDLKPELSTEQFYSNPEIAAERLKEILTQNSVKTKIALFVIDTKEILTRKLTIPPIADMSLMRSVVLTSFERQTKLSQENITLDYTGSSAAQKQNDILIAAILKSKLDMLCRIAETAKLKICSIVPDFLVVCEAVRDKSYQHYIVSRCDSAKIIVADMGFIKDVSYVSFSSDKSDAAQKIASEIIRNPLLFNLSRTKEIKLLSEDANLEKELSRILPADIRYKNILQKNHSVNYILGRSLLEGKSFDIDFFQSHLKVRKQSRFKEYLPRILICILVILVFVSWFFISWHQDKKAIAQLRTECENIAPSAIEAQELIDKVTYAKSWYDTKPFYTECMKQITSAFSDESSIWTSSLAIDSDFIVVMTGRSIGEQNIITFLDGLKKSGCFDNIKMLYMRQAGKNSSEVSYAINFKYLENK